MINSFEDFKKNLDDQQLDEDIQIFEKTGESNFIIDFIFRRPKIIKLYKELAQMEIKALKTGNELRKSTSQYDDKIEEIDKKLKDGRLPADTVAKLKTQKAQLIQQKNKASDTSYKISQKRLQSLRDDIQDIRYKIQKFATSPYLEKISSKQDLKTSIQVSKLKMEMADEEDRAAIEKDLQLFQKGIQELDKDLQTENKLAELRNNIDEMDDKISAIKRKITSETDDTKKSELESQEKKLLKTRYEKTLKLGKKYNDEIKDPENLQKSLKTLLDKTDRENTDLELKTFSGFEEFIKQKIADLNIEPGDSQSDNPEAQNSSFNPYESIASRFSRLMSARIR